MNDEQWDREFEMMRQRCESLAHDHAKAVAERDEARAERDAYKRAKEENDDRFMVERDQARRERDEARQAATFAEVYSDGAAFVRAHNARRDEVERLTALCTQAYDQRDRALRERDALLRVRKLDAASYVTLRAKLDRYMPTQVGEHPGGGDTTSGDTHPPEPAGSTRDPERAWVQLTENPASHPRIGQLVTMRNEYGDCWSGAYTKEHRYSASRWTHWSANPAATRDPQAPAPHTCCACLRVTTLAPCEVCHRATCQDCGPCAPESMGCVVPLYAVERADLDALREEIAAACERASEATKQAASSVGNIGSYAVWALAQELRGGAK